MKVQKESIVKTGEEITIYLNGKWSVFDMQKYFNALNYLYQYYGWTEIIINDLDSQKGILALSYLNSRCLGRSTTIIDQEYNTWIQIDNEEIVDNDLLQPLIVKKIQYASPGMNDLFGAGTIVGHLKDILLKLIDIFLNRKARKTEIEKLILENETIKIENQILQLKRNQELIKTLKNLGIKNEEIKILLDKEKKHLFGIVQLIDEGKITYIE